ncbi:glycoside hydrolase family 25 protein [Lactococcus nasutitermitis]|uniref:Glycoside hydrolase family 25 protein n=2 Tax=Lactococcus nasutitermitis TaxID=1652957 RepID=A0ABV9JGV2_9LACT|nr:glycoside hydrolase family 25 protein [Lactococcus nasutitermitis]
MRRKLKKITAVIFIICMFGIVALIGVIRFRPQIQMMKRVVFNTSLQHSTTDLNKPVIDLSGWQRPKEIDYNVLSEHVIGAIIRVQATEGISDGSATKTGEDVAYKEHIQAFKKRGVPVAVYAYVTGKNVSQMKTQAKSFYKHAKNFQPSYYWLDVEVTNMKNMNAGIEAFRSELAKLGAKNIGIYAQDWFITDNHIDTKRFDAIWMADYGRDTGYWDASPTTTLNYSMQQFTDKGTVPGYTGDVDLSMVRTQKDYDKLFKSKGN